MAVNFRKVSSVYHSKVYTEDGYFLGEVEDAIISGNKVYGWKIKIGRSNLLKRNIKGLIVPHQLVKAMGEIWIVSKAVSSTTESRETTEETESKENIEKTE